MKLKKIRNQILQEAKPCVIKYGWNENLFVNMKNDSKFTNEEMNVLFPKGYTTLIEMYLEEINTKMTVESQKNNLISLRGTLVPATTLNKAIGSIPFLGKILVGKKIGEGVFGLSFKIKGPPKDLKTTVNPIKTLTPRFIVRTLEKIKTN